MSTAKSMRLGSTRIKFTNEDCVHTCRAHFDPGEIRIRTRSSVTASSVRVCMYFALDSCTPAKSTSPMIDPLTVFQRGLH